MLKKKIIITTMTLLGATILASCTNSETTKEIGIVYQCVVADGLCSFELANVAITKQTDLLGKTTTKVSKTSSLGPIVGTINWVSPGTLADNTKVIQAGLPACEGDFCTDSSNPAAYAFEAGTHIVSVSGNVTVDGSAIDLSTVPSVTVTSEISRSHTFLHGTDPAPPASMQAIVNALNTNKAQANADFSVNGSSWQITCHNGFHWDETIDPAWGTELEHPYLTRGTAYVSVYPNAINTGSNTTKWTINSYDFLNPGPWASTVHFEAGCWED